MNSVVKAVRANYAALQHRPDGRRVALDVEAIIPQANTARVCWRFWVVADTMPQRKRELTRALNRIRAMYPWGIKAIAASYADGVIAL